MKKKLVGLLGLLFVTATAVGLAGCGGDDGGDDDVILTPSEGLSYMLIDGGATYEVAGMGSCLDTEIVIPSVYGGKFVTSIAYGAFEDCYALTSVVIPDSVTSIGDRAFSGCNILRSVTISDNVTSIGFYAFKDTKVIEVVGGVRYVDTCVIGWDVVDITTVNIREGTKNIVSFVGSNCYFTSIVIPDSVKSIGDYVFAGCNGLTSITVDKNNANYASQDGILYNKAKTEFICIPKGVTGKIEVPKTITTIDKSEFSGCDKLTSITVDKNNANYASQDGILYNKAKTEFICIPKGVTGKIEVPDSITEIGGGAFSGCSSLTSIIIPDSVTTIGYQAFSGCSGLESITLPFVGESKESTSNTHFGYIFGAYNYYDNYSHVPASLKTVVITGGQIGDYAFSICSGLTSIVIPDGVTSIGGSAFSICSGLTSIVIPDGVTSIGESAFSGCSGLTGVYYNGTESEWKNISIGSYAFYKVSATRYYYSEEAPMTSGNYWHYGSDGVTPVKW